MPEFKKAAVSIASHMIKESRKNVRDNTYIRGSSIGMCPRRIGYQVLGFDATPNDAHSLFTLSFGTAIHEMIQRNLVAMGLIKAVPYLTPEGFINWQQTDDPESGCELTIASDELRILGHCDGVTVPLRRVDDENSLHSYVPDYENGERYLIEIKSITDKTNFWVKGIRNGDTTLINEADYDVEFIDVDFEMSSTPGKENQKLSRFAGSRKVRTQYGVREFPIYKIKTGTKDELVTVLMIGNTKGAFSSLKEPKPEHISQASLYASELKLKKILFIYVGKDVNSRHYEVEGEISNVPIKVLEHTVDEFDVDMNINKIEQIYSYTDNKELPPRGFNWEDQKAECKFCPFAYHCYPDKVSLQDINLSLERIGTTPIG